MKNSNALEELKDSIHELAVEYFKLAHRERILKEVKKGKQIPVVIIENTEKPFMLIITETESVVEG